MFEKINWFDDHHMLLVSRHTVFVIIGILLTMTFSLMMFFLHIDFDSLLGRKGLAMKVGQTTISLDELRQIQAISGVKAKKLDAAAFASEFFDTLLFAEGGRRLGLDRRSDFIRKVSVFDRASRRSDDKETLARAVFLIEELAAAARQEVAEANFHPAELAEIKVSVPAPKPRLHLKTILVADEEQAQNLQTESAEGAAFAELNASWSLSLYRGVGGDVGLKSVSDFPAGVFAKLLAESDDTLVRGFADDAGIHFFSVTARPQIDPAQHAKAERELQLRELRRRRLLKYMVELRNSLEYWVNPVLQARCQTVGKTAAADSRQ